MKVSIVYSGDITLINGVVSVIEQMYKGLKKYSDSDLCFKAIYCSNGIVRELSDLEQVRSVIPAGRFRKAITQIKKKSYCLSLLRVYQIFIRNAKLVAKKVVENCESEEILICEDFLSAYYILKSGLNNPVFFVSHSDEYDFSQLFMDYPRLKGRKINLFLNGVAEFVYKNVRCTICVSRNKQKYLLKRYKNVKYIHNGFEFDNVNIISKKRMHDSLRLISVGSIGYRKGFDRLVEIALECKKKNLPVKITCVGGGPEKVDFEKMVHASQIESIIRFTGERRDISELLSKADVFVLLSRNEALPVSIIEAMSMGLPVIATNVGGISEFFDRESELLLAEFSIDRFMDILNKILNKEIDLNFYGKENYSRYIQEFSTKKMINNYRNLIMSEGR